MPEARRARVDGRPDARARKQGQGRDDGDDGAAGRAQEDVRQPARLNSSRASARRDDAGPCGLRRARAAGRLSSRALPPPVGGRGAGCGAGDSLQPEDTKASRVPNVRLPKAHPAQEPKKVTIARMRQPLARLEISVLLV